MSPVEEGDESSPHPRVSRKNNSPREINVTGRNRRTSDSPLAGTLKRIRPPPAEKSLLGVLLGAGSAGEEGRQVTSHTTDYDTGP